MADTTVTSEELQKRAEEFVASGKRGRPHKDIAPLVKALKRKQRAKDRYIKVKSIKQLREVAHQQKVNEKLEAFLEEFMKNGGNATQAALTVNPTISIASAANLGVDYMKQVRGLAQVHLEKRGYGYGKLMEIAMKKVEEGRTPEWWDRLMKMAGYEDFLTKNIKGGGPAVVNIVGEHKKQVEDFGFAEEGEIVDETS